MQIRSIDHVELFVEDAETAAARLRDCFGFALAGRGGARTGLRGCESVLLRQREITLLITSATDAEHRVGAYVREHGDGVGVVGLLVDDARAAFAEAVERGAVPVAPPEVAGAEGDRVVFASVTGVGDVEHRFVSRERSWTSFAPVIEESGCGRSGGGLLRAFDHLALCVPAGALDETVRYYEEVFGLCRAAGDESVAGSRAMGSTVMRNASGTLTFTVLEPDTAHAPRETRAFVAAHGGAGVQHIAFLAEDVEAAVRTGAQHGVRFRTAPPRPGGAPSPEPLQLCTESRHPRKTLFYELIDHRGGRAFGADDARARR